MCEVLLLCSVIKRSEDNGIFPVEAGFIYIIIKLLWCRYRIYVIWYCMDVCIHLNISCTLFILCVIFVRKRDFNLNESFSWINRGYILRDNNFYEVVIFNGLKWSLNVGLTKQSFILYHVINDVRSFCCPLSTDPLWSVNRIWKPLQKPEPLSQMSFCWVGWEHDPVCLYRSAFQSDHLLTCLIVFMFCNGFHPVGILMIHVEKYSSGRNITELRS